MRSNKDILNTIEALSWLFDDTPRNNRVKQYLNVNGKTLINDFDDTKFHDKFNAEPMTITNKHKADKYGIKKVIINKPAVIIIWADGTKTMAKCEKGDRWDAEKGFAIALAKHYVGNGAFNDMLSRYVWDMED